MPVVHLENNDDENRENQSDEKKSNVEIKITENIEDDLDDDLEPQIIPKDTIPQEEIFNDGPVVNPIPDPRNKKRVMSQKQKDHLARIRKKALESKRIKREEKEAAQRLVKEEKQAKKEAKKQVSFDESPTTVKHVGYSQEQLDSSIARALEAAEVRRKKRKAEKKVIKEQEKKDEQTIRVISNAVNRVPTEEDLLWRSCFSR